MELDWLEKATLNDLRLKLRTKQYHVFHFIGHGGFDRQHQQGILVFEDEQQRGQWVSGEQLGVLLRGFRSLRLVVLNACEGARNSLQDPFAGVATTLALNRVPAVVAMQFEISDKAAIAFSADFYSVLAQGGAVDEAVSEARQVMLPSEAEWEKAARGPAGFEWPWGSVFDAARCNTAESNAGGTTPLGTFSPLGDNPYGCADMAGSVWEWTRSHYKPYPYDPADGREDLADFSPRVLRGGSFNSYFFDERCSCRSRRGPYRRNNLIGFRVGVRGPIHL